MKIFFQTSSFGFVPGATPPEPPPGSPRCRFATPPHRGDPTCPSSRVTTTQAVEPVLMT